MRRFTIISALIAAIAAFAAIAPVASASGGGTTTTAALHGSASFPAANGKAVYKVKGSERELQIEVEDVRSLAGMKVKVFVNGALLASPKVSNLGAIRVARNTDNGQTVPVISKGSTVRVRTLGGTMIASGAF
jgi:predicted PilT family ATPase